MFAGIGHGNPTEEQVPWERGGRPFIRCALARLFPFVRSRFHGHGVYGIPNASLNACHDVIEQLEAARRIRAPAFAVRIRLPVCHPRCKKSCKCVPGGLPEAPAALVNLYHSGSALHQRVAHEVLVRDLTAEERVTLGKVELLGLLERQYASPQERATCAELTELGLLTETDATTAGSGQIQKNVDHHPNMRIIDAWTRSKS